jgi:hypothetical protein
MARFLTIVAGIYLMLIGLLFLGIVVLGLMYLPNEKAHEASTTLALVNLPIALWLFATAVGIFMKKNWARVSLIIMSVLTILGGLGMMASLQFVPSSSAHVTHSAIIFYSTFLILIPAVLLTIFNFSAVKVLFLGVPAGGTYGQSSAPLGVKLIAVCYLLSLIGLPFNLLRHDLQLPIVGDLFLSGLTAKFYLVLMTAIGVYIGVGLWRLQPKAWRVFMAYNTVWMALGAASMFMLTEEGIARMMPPDSAASISVSSYRFFMAIGLVFGLAVIFYIYQKKTLFLRVAGGRSK